MVDRYWRKIESIENDVENSMQISSIPLKLKRYDEKLDDLSKIDANKNNISSNLTKINNIKNDMNIRIRKNIYKKTFIIPNMSTNYNSKNIGDIYSISNLTADGIIKINANCNYSYGKTNNFSHVYKFYNNGKNLKKLD